MAVLLIGSTGSGKSTLGNFLIDPKVINPKEKKDKQFFKRGTTNLPKTRSVSRVQFRDQDTRNNFTVIDTPGLNDSDIKDFKHMIQIVESLQSVDKVLACVFVVKFDSKIDIQYKTTVQYYRKLLPSLFDRNVIIVMTAYASHQYAIREREMNGTNVEQIKGNAIREIAESGNLSYDPLLFMIDSLPLDKEQLDLSKLERKAILSKIASLSPFYSKNLKVAKTPYLKAQDKEKIREYEGKIASYREQFQQADQRLKEAFEKIQRKGEEIAEIDIEIKSLTEELANKDNSELMEVINWSVSEHWRLFGYRSQEFDLTSPFEIEEVSKWTNGHCEWKQYEQTTHRVKGRVEGEFMRGIYANLTIKTFKRNKYKDEIISLKQQRRERKDRKESLTQQLIEIRSHHREHEYEIERFRGLISEMTEWIESHAGDYLSLEEAHERLKILESNK